MISSQNLAAHHLQEALRHLSMAESFVQELPREDSADLAASVMRARLQVEDLAIEIKPKEA